MKPKGLSTGGIAKNRLFPGRFGGNQIEVPHFPTRARLGFPVGVRSDPEPEAARDGGDITVPLSALAEKDGSKIVWTVDRKEATVHSRSVEVSDFTGEGVDVTKGLKPGDLVVSAGTQFMSENLKVKLPDIIGQVTADLLK